MIKINTGYILDDLFTPMSHYDVWIKLDQVQAMEHFTNGYGIIRTNNHSYTVDLASFWKVLAKIGTVDPREYRPSSGV